MSGRLQDVWLAEVEAEYLALLEAGRDVGVDVGNQFRAFEHLLERGLDAKWRPIDRVDSTDIYVMYGRYALMFFAVQERRVAVVKWTVLGTEHQQRQAREEA